MNLLELTEFGLYCPPAGIFIDPWRPVEKAVITHAHADHARRGMKQYLAHAQSKEVMKLRLGKDIQLQTMCYGETVQLNGVSLSLHPAGHIPGSAQVRLEYQGKVAVVSGDYKVEDDGLSTPFEPVKCHEFVSECTFGMPIYDWEPQAEVFKQINDWWKNNAAQGLNSVIFAYSLGKAQRILTHLQPEIGEIFVHGVIANTNEALAADGLALPNYIRVNQDLPKSSFKGALIIAPPAVMNGPWLKKFSPYRSANCSGWMNVRGIRRRSSLDHGFVLSDHADWKGLITAIHATGAEKVYLTHGSTAIFGKFLQEEKGIDAVALETLFGEEEKD
jgi:putative mRNA 3-end processing factor